MLAQIIAPSLIHRMTAFKSSLLLSLALLAAPITGCLSTHPHSSVIHLLHDNDLSGFYPFLKEFGKDTDPDHVFTLTNGVLRISGQHYGYLATRKTNFTNYKLI